MKTAVPRSLRLPLWLPLGLFAASAWLAEAQPAPPTITVQPRNQTAALGGRATFQVNVTGGTPISFRWRRNGLTFTGGIITNNALDSSLTVTNPTAADNGALFSVVVTNLTGNVTSSNAVLTLVGGAVSINEFMASNVTTLVDEDNTFQDWMEFYNAGPGAVNMGGWSLTDTATGQNRWFFPPVSIDARGFLLVFASAKNRTNTTAPLHSNFRLGSAAGFIALSAPDGTQIDSVSYGAQANDISQGRYPNGASSMFFMTIPTPNASNVLAIPVITTQPQSQSACLSNRVTFTVAASGDQPIAYQWRFNGSPITGATSNVFTIASVLASSFGDYTVVASNPAGSATSSVARLSLNPPVTITRQPSNVVVACGTVTFSVGVSNGIPPLLFQWFRNGTPIPNATAQSYSFSATRADNGSVFRVAVSDSCSSTVSSNALLTVADTQPPSITCPSNMVFIADSGRCNRSNVTYFPFATDNCDGSANLAVVCVPPSGTAFAIGVRQVNCTATDSSGNSAPCSFTVTVLSSQPPVLNCPSNIVTSTDPGQCRKTNVIYFVSAFDPCNTPGVPVVCTPPSGSTFPKGVTTVFCTATNSSTNVASCNFTVTVLDQSPPTLHCPENIFVTATRAEGAIVSYNVTATDSCGSNVTVNCSIPSGSLFPVGTTPVICTAGVAGTQPNNCRFDVTVESAPCRVSNKGREFWLTFPANFPDPINPQLLGLYILGPPGTVGTVEMSNPAFSVPFNIPAGSTWTAVVLPPQADAGEANDAILTNGIHLTATQPVAVFGLNHIDYSTDGYLALPVGILGTDYLVLNYANTHTNAPDLNGTQFALAATEDNTEVRIKPSVTTGLHPAGVWYTNTMNRWETYQLRNTNGAPNDLSGTIISSDKPLAVFGSHRCDSIPDGQVWFCDHLVEQLLPTQLWGREFLTQPLATRQRGDRFRVVAANDKTTVTVMPAGGPNFAVTLNQGEVYETGLAGPGRFFADQKILLAQYGQSSDFDGVVQADPTMFLIPAVEQYLSNYVVWTPTNGFSKNFLNLTSKGLGAGALINVIVDGISFSLTPVPGGGYSTTTVPVAPGAHTVFSAVPFGITVYGFAEYNAYGYPGGLCVAEQVPPSIFCVSNITVVLSNSCLTEVPDLAGQVGAFDNCTSRDRLIITQQPPPGTTVGPGSHPIVILARDEADNVGRCNATFTVIDATPIKLSPTDVVVNCTTNGAARVTYSVVAESLCSSNATVICNPPSGTVFPPGTSSVICTATNGVGQTFRTAFPVAVRCLQITLAANGTLTLSWPLNATLQTASELTGRAGDWQDVPTTGNTYTPPPTIRQSFYRLRFLTP